MAYYKRRRYSRSARNRKALTTRRIYSRTGSRAQAAQIAALRNKINYVAKRNKPEIKSRYSGASKTSFTSNAGSQVYNAFPGTLPPAGVTDAERMGDFIRVKSLTWYFTFEYIYSLPTSTALPDSEGCTIRLIVGQYKRPQGGTDVPVPTAIIDQYNTAGAAYTHNTVAPLRRGISEDYWILKDKKFVLTRDSNNKFFKLRIKPHNYRWSPDGSVNNCWCAVFVSGLHWDTTRLTQTVDMTISDKIVYTDA